MVKGANLQLRPHPEHRLAQRVDPEGSFVEVKS
jgi:hypothetical protein